MHGPIKSALIASAAKLPLITKRTLINRRALKMDRLKIVDFEQGVRGLKSLN